VKKLNKVLVAAVIASALGSMAWAALYDVTVGGTTGLPINGRGATYKLEGYVDCTAETYGADTLKVISIPKNTMVLGVKMNVLVPTPNAVTIGVGDGTSATTWMAAKSTTNHVTTPVVFSSSSNCVSYVATNSVIVTLSGAPGATGMIKITAVCVDYQ